MMFLAVAVLAMINSKTNAFPLSTVIIEQYRPPIDKFIIGELRALPSDLIFTGYPQSCQQVFCPQTLAFALLITLDEASLTKVKQLKQLLSASSRRRLASRQIVF
jgi:hypothetical protein